MDTIFKYKGKIISTPNLEKKLRKMKISIDDIEIINNVIKKEESGLEDYMLNKEEVIVKSKLDNIRRICYVPKGTRPPIKELLGKSGIYTDFMLESMYYEG